MMSLRTTEENGVKLVSVTSAMELVRKILGEEELYGPKALMKQHLQEGSGCHSVCLDWAMCGNETPLEAVMPPAPEDYPNPSLWAAVMERAWLAFREFVVEYHVEVIGVEQPCTAPAYGLMGHPDLICWLIWNKRRIKAVNDLKFTTGIIRSHYIQVRCYAKMKELSDMNMGFIWQCDRSTGQWKLEPVPLNGGLDDVVAVSCAARLWAWSQR